MKKNVKNFLTIFLIIILISAYPIYVLIFWNVSKSPDDFSLFPISGVWVCETDNFTITINLDKNKDDDITTNAMNAKSITITFDDYTYQLGCFESGGHGTIFAPIAPATIIKFETMGDLPEDVYNKNNVNFSVSKFKFNKDNFYLLNISLSSNHKLKYITDNMTLHFIKKVYN